MHTFEQKNITTLILKMGIPSMMGMLVIALYHAVDTYFISGLGTEAVAAAAVVFPISMLVSGIAFAFGTGAASAVSRLIGGGDHVRAEQVASTSVYSAVGLSALLAMVIAWFHTPVFSLFGADAQVLEQAETYGLIILIGSVINTGTLTANNIIRAEGFAKTSMLTMSIGAVVNVLLDPLMIYTLGMGITGAALATVVAQTAALGFIAISYRRTDSVVKLSIRQVRFDRTIYGQVLKIGIPVLIYQGLSSVAIAVINRQARVYGAEAVAALGIATRLIVLLSYVVFGFVKGLQPIAGYTFGAQQYDRLRQAIRTTSTILSSYCFAAAAGVIAFAPSIISWFTADPQVAALGRHALVLWSSTFIFLGYQMTYVTAFLALGMAREGSIIGLSRQGVLLIPLLFLLKALLGLEGLIYAQPAADLLTLLLTIYHARALHRLLGHEGMPEHAASA
jgi:putative MATE family efflux protein